MDTSPATGRTASDPPHHTPPDLPVSPGSAPLARPANRAAAALTVAAVLAQITYPLLSGAPLRAATIGAVLLFSGASLAHAAAVHGPAVAVRVLAVAGGIGLAAEALGVATGVPFGTYAYAGTLGPTLLGVPLLVPIAWTMTAYPCLLLGRRLVGQLVQRSGRGPDRGPAGRGPARRGLPAATTAVLGGVTLAAWDLYLDPQMVAAGHWVWRFPEPALPGVPGVPLTNYAGWVVVAVVMIAALDRVVPGRVAPDGDGNLAGPEAGAGARPGEAVPAALLAWTWFGSALGNLAFFGRPAVAAYGGVVMGLTVVPYLLLVRQDRPPAQGRKPAQGRDPGEGSGRNRDREGAR